MTIRRTYTHITVYAVTRERSTWQTTWLESVCVTWPSGKRNHNVSKRHGQRQRANPHEFLVFGVAQILIERTVAHLARFTCQIATSTTAAVINKQTMNNNNSELPITATLTIVSALTTAVTVCRNCRASKCTKMSATGHVTWQQWPNKLVLYHANWLSRGNDCDNECWPPLSQDARQLVRVTGI